MGLTAIREGMKANLLLLDGVQVHPYVLANATPPCIWIRPSSDTVVEYHQTMGPPTGDQEWNMSVEAIVPAGNDIGGQMLLDRWLEGELVTALESDRTLGGAAEDITVTEARGYGEFVRPDGTAVFKAEWLVTVFSSDSGE